MVGRHGGGACMTAAEAPPTWWRSNAPNWRASVPVRHRHEPLADAEFPAPFCRLATQVQPAITTSTWPKYRCRRLAFLWSKARARSVLTRLRWRRLRRFIYYGSAINSILAEALLRLRPGRWSDAAAACLVSEDQARSRRPGLRLVGRSAFERPVPASALALLRRRAFG
jgi:hypothetical protein